MIVASQFESRWDGGWRKKKRASDSEIAGGFDLTLRKSLGSRPLPSMSLMAACFAVGSKGTVQCRGNCRGLPPTDSALGLLVISMWAGLAARQAQRG